MNRIVGLFVLVVVAVFVLVACGGSGGGEGGDIDYRISGQVTLNGTGLSGVYMSLDGKSATGTTTDASGNYTFTGLGFGSYIIRPSKKGFAFSPVNSLHDLNGANITAVNFTATPAPFSISGQVTLNGTGLSGVDVSMWLSEIFNASTFTDASGNYTITDVANGSYTIRPAKFGYNFSPTSSQQTVSGANITAVNFAATPAPFSISGQVTLNGTGLSGVSMELSGGISVMGTTTDASGNYTFNYLVNGNYTITPWGGAGLTFSPASSQQTVSGANITAVNFAATPAFSITGQVTLNGTGLSGVTMSVSDGISTTGIAADVNGNYTFTGLVNGNYTITPRKTGFTFSPTSSQQTVSGANITGVNFIATHEVTHSISGNVVSGATFSAVPGVTMALSGASSATTTTDASGNYTFTDLVNGSYTIRPSKAGYTFNPIISQQTVSGANITAVNFTATGGPFSISGQVTWNGTGLSAVIMSLSGEKSATTITDVSGNYTFTGLDNGSYTITPNRTGFTFSPTSSQQTMSGANITGVNFTVTSGPSAQTVSCPPTGTTNVMIQDFSFTPQNVTISANGIVKWTNNGPSAHTVTSGTTPTPDSKFSAGYLPIGVVICVQFYETGTYPYFCTIHPTMTGSVVVQ